MRATALFAMAGAGALWTVLLVGCGSPTAAPVTQSPAASSLAAPTSTASSTLSVSSQAATPGSSPASAAPTATSPPTGTGAGPTVPAEWKSFTTADGTLTFNYPPTWIIKDATSGDGADVHVLTDYGRTIASLRTGIVTGAECAEKMPFMVYDSAPVPALAQGGQVPRFVYEARTQSMSKDPVKATTFAFGLTSAPEPTGTEACPMAHFFNWPPSGASFGGVYDPFDTTPGKPMRVDTPEVYTDTAEYQQAKQMIMSLRPAEK